MISLNYKLCWTQIQEGNKDAFNRLFRSLYPELKAYGLKISQREDLVQEAVQRLFIKLWERRKRLGSVQSVKGYILKAFRRTLIDLLTAEQKRTTLATTAPFSFQLSPEDLKIHQQEQEKQAEQISMLLQKLPENQREVIYLRFYNRLSYPEIAEIMGMNYQTVRNYGSKAIRALIKQWKEF